MKYFEKIRNEIPVVTILVVTFYFFTYFFQLGYSVFWGFPSDYIEINLDVMLSTSAAFIMVLLIASHLLEGLISGQKTSFLTASLYCCLFFFIISLMICGAKTTFDIFRGVYYLEHFIIFSFVACGFYASSGIRRCFAQSFTPSKITTVILTLISLCGVALLSGMLYCLMPWRGYTTSDNMVLVAKYSDKSILGRCEGKIKTFKIIPANSDVTMTKRGSNKMKELKRCFIDNI